MARFQAKSGLQYQKLIEALATQPTIEKAALAAGISKRTLYRRLQEPDFQEALAEFNQAAFSQTLAQLQYDSNFAVLYRRKLLVNPSTPASVKAQLTNSMVSQCLKAHEIAVVEARATAAKSDTDLRSKIGSELLGMVRGMIETTVPHSGEGLGVFPPLTATESCRAGQDRLQEFLQDRGLVAIEGNGEFWKKEKCWVPVAQLYTAYMAWEAARGDPHPLPKWSFEERLRQLGLEKQRVRPAGRRETRQVWVWLGIRFHAAAKLPV